MVLKQWQLGQTALHGACAAAHGDIVARLLRGGADVNIVDKRFDRRFSAFVALCNFMPGNLTQAR